MKSETTLAFKTHYKFLNSLLKLKLSGWQRNTFPLSGKRHGLWFLRIDGGIRNGWIDAWISHTQFEEKNVDGKQLELNQSPRHVFEITNCNHLIGNLRNYTYKGEFRVNEKMSTTNNLIWEKIADSTDLF